MKKINIGAIVCSVLILVCACSIGIVSVSALTVDGQDVLSDLASVGTSLGIDLGDFVSTTETTETKTSAPDAEEQLGQLIENLQMSTDVLAITDLVRYLQSGKSFADWIYENYGETVDIPESVREMPTKDVILYLMGTMLYPSETTAQAATSSDYIFTTTETQASQTAVKPTAAETETRSSVIIYPSDATAASWKTGDVNNDGNITAADARLALRASATLDILSGSAFDAADVNGDGIITAKDARSILRYAAQITNSF